MSHLAILGAGGWGTALALAAIRAGQHVKLWARRAEFAQELRQHGENRRYLPNVPLPPQPQLLISSQIAEVLTGASMVFVVVPSVGVPEILADLSSDYKRVPLVLCAKGLASDGQPLSEWASSWHFDKVAVLSGPNHAEEIGRGLPAATVVASQDEQHALTVQGLLTSPSFRLYTSRDVIGVELGGVLKNVMAVAAGMSDGLQLGDNAKASLLTRGLREMSCYLDTLGALPETVYGLSGLGDLLTTATSKHSRNRAAGEAIARGNNPEQGGKVVEGLRTARLLHDWALAEGHDLPIVAAVAKVVSNECSPEDALADLMSRHPRAE